METPDARSSAVLPHRPAGRTAPLKPWEVRGSASITSRPALTTSSPISPSTSSSSSTTLATTASPRPPARPWERSRSDAGALSRYDDNSYGGSYNRDSYLNSSRVGYGGGYGSSSSYGSNYGGYGSGGYGSSYGGGGGYGGYRDRDYGYGSSSYGGYGSGGYGSGGYGSGGYGSSYGGGYGGNYGGYGGGYGRGDPYYDKPGILANGFSWMNSVQYVVDTFSRFSRLLDANYDAMHGSFTSVLRLAERMGQLNSEVMLMIKTFTIFRLFQSFSGRFVQVFRYMTGRPMIKDGIQSKADKGKGFNVRDFQEFTRKDSSRAPGWGSMMLVFFITFVGLPVVLHRIVILFARSRQSDPLELQWTQNGQQQEKVRALYSFTPETNRDLPFEAGDILVVINKGHPDWWEAEANGRVGLIPANFVEPIENTDKSLTHDNTPPNDTSTFDKYTHPPDE